MPMNPRLLRPLASGFNPRSISGLAAWWDAADASTITLDANGNVQEWRDKSASANHASQSVANNRPTILAGQLNGRNVIGFDGNNDGLVFTGVARTDETVFVVAFADIIPGTLRNNVIMGGIQANAQGVRLIAKDDGAQSAIDVAVGGFSTGVNRVNTTIGAGSIGPVLVTLARSAATGLRSLRNNVTLGTATTSVSFSFGRLGVSGNSDQYLDGYIAEAIIYDRLVTADERGAVSTYLLKKWGLA